MGDVIVRPARWGDRRAITELIAAMGSHEDVLESPDPLLELGALISRPSSRALVAELDGRVVGYAELQSRPSSLHDGVEGWLGALVVDATQRRSGVGASLMEAIEREAVLLGCDEIVVESSSWRNSSHAFYRKIGFSQGSRADRFRRKQVSTSSDESKFLALAARAANRVAAVLAPWVGVATANKEADVDAEAVAVKVLSQMRLPVLAEEGGWSQPPREGLRWVCLDAVDGSRNLRAGLPPWAFSVALVEDGRSVAGFVCNLASGRRWWAVRGGGSWVDGRPANARRGGLVGIGSRPDSIAELPSWTERIRVLGATTVELCCVADGSFAGFVGLGAITIHVQDVAAASVILEEAGACLIDDGQSPVRIDQDREARLQVVAAADIELARDLLGVGIQAASPV